MGGQCASTRSKQQFEIVREYEHPTLGFIKVIRSLKNHHNNSTSSNALLGTSGHSYSPKDGELIGVKQVTFGTQKQLQQYLKYVKQANSYYKIPTLLRIISYEIQAKNSGASSSINPGLKFSNNNYSCGSTYSLNLYFNYCQYTLEDILRDKRKQLSSMQINNRNKRKLPKNLKLNDYEQIDKLPHHDRKVVNIFYQQVQILRMIDHIVGALYFLNHLQHKHEAVCPQHILIDEEGKFILMDAAVFQLNSNYEDGLMEYSNKIFTKSRDKYKNNTVTSKLNYLSPELLMHVKNKHGEHHQSSEKAEVFSVGLIALDMCLLQYAILDESPKDDNWPVHGPLLDRINLKLNKNQLNKALIQARSLYSNQLIQLLACMLEYDPVKRITFSTLIDMLSPLLARNLSQIQNLYNTSVNMPDLSISQRNGYRNQNSYMNRSGNVYTNQLMNKLSQLQTNYQKIMNSRLIFQHNCVDSSDNPQHRKTYDQAFIIEDQKRILKELKKINVISGNSSHAHNLKHDKGGLRPKERREVKSSQLYDLYLNEYQTIKQNRFR